MKTYWISFATKKINLGCCIIDAENEKEAINKTIELKINPGGEAMFTVMPPDNLTVQEEIKLWGKDRLISLEDLKNRNYKQLKDLSENDQERILNNPLVSHACEKHNNTL